MVLTIRISDYRARAKYTETGYDSQRPLWQPAGVSLDRYQRWIAEGLKQPKKSQTGLAAALRITQPRISEIVAGKRKVQSTEIPRAANYLGIPPPDASPKFVPLVGYVGAGSAAHFYADGQGPFETVEAPADSTDETVAVEVRGDSLGSMFNRSLVFYDEVRRPVTTDLIGKACVIGLSDGRVLIKQLMRSRDKTRFHLLSHTEDPILDVIVEWAARVKAVVPR